MLRLPCLALIGLALWLMARRIHRSDETNRATAKFSKNWDAAVQRCAL